MADILTWRGWEGVVALVVDQGKAGSWRQALCPVDDCGRGQDR